MNLDVITTLAVIGVWTCLQTIAYSYATQPPGLISALISLKRPS